MGKTNDDKAGYMPGPGETARSAGLPSGKGSLPQGMPQVKGPRPSMRNGGCMNAIRGEDSARKRILKTPQVFQSTTERLTSRNQRELRSNLLPSIMWAPLENTQTQGDSNHTEAMGDFHRQYQEELELRAKGNDEVAFFLERDPAFPDTDRDPQQIVAESCAILKDLVADKLTRFRRAQECLINTSSELPFVHSDQGLDLAELSDLFTLDLERRESGFAGTTNGFLSLQVSSRLPMIVRDPSAPSTGVRLAKLESERLDKDLHMIRVDLQPGEVRQVAYRLDDPDFKSTDLAKRMSAVINPEQSMIAQLVRTLRAKEAEAKTVNSILNDILRDLPDELPQTAQPDLESVNEQASAARLRDLMQGPRETLKRTLEAVEKLAALAAPLAPSLSHALDRIALICVREVDRLAVRCHRDYENVLQAWRKAEEERRELVNMIDRMGGRGSDGGGGVELRNRVGKLHNDLMTQEQLYSNLLVEYRENLGAADEYHNIVAGLRQKNSALQGQIAALQREKRDYKRDHTDTSTSPPRPPASKEHHSAQIELAAENGGGPKELERSGSKHISPQQRSGSEQLPLKREALKSYAEGLLSFTVPVSTQTPSSHFFNDNAELNDELGLAEFEDTMRISNRLFAILCKYEWNAVACKYFLKNSEIDSDTEDPKSTAEHPIDARLTRMLALRGLRVKVERSHVRAQMCQLEEENDRLQACAKEGCGEWARKDLAELSSKKMPVTDVPVRPGDLWEQITKLVHNDGMRARIRELEDQLTNLLPLAERARGGDTGAGGEASSLFWARVMRQVKTQNKVSIDRAPKDHIAARGRRRSSAGEVPQMDVPRLMTELAAIWSSLLSQQRDQSDTSKAVNSRLGTQAVLQACVKTFYLRKSGRSKFVEAAVVALCKCVCDQLALFASPKISLFSVMIDIHRAENLEGKLPGFTRPVDMELQYKLLSDLPLDSAYVMANFMVEIKTLRQSKKYLGQIAGGLSDLKADQDTGDTMLPMQLIIASGRTCITCRSRATTNFYNLALLGFAEFSPRIFSKKIVAKLLDNDTLAAEEDRGSADDEGSDTGASPVSPVSGDRDNPASPDSPGRESVDSPGRTSLSQGLTGGDRTTLQDMVFISHVIHAYVWKNIDANAAVGILTLAETDKEKEQEVLHVLWSRLLENAHSVSQIRRALGLSTNQAACNGKKVAECLVKWGVVPLPVEVVKRSINLVCGLPSDATGDVHMEKDMFMHLCQAFRFCGDDGGVRIRESIVLWAGLWALCYERQHELKQMGRLFILHDTSNDGWLQFDEFAQFMKAVSPGTNHEEMEELFLCGAEEVQGDMTKEVFLSLVLRLGITSDLDMLDDLITSKTMMFGE